MPKYQNSTHQKFWVFDSSKLLEIQSKRDEDLSSFITSQTGDQSLLKYQVTHDEEKSVLYLISLNLIKACKHFNMHDKAISTALTYFKRFYLYNSICKYDPAVMMFTVMFLACKTEEINVGGVETICQQFRGTEANAILELEFVLLSEIKFQLYIFSPYKPLTAFLENIPEDLLPPAEKATRLEKTRGIIENFLVSDTCLKLSPSETALTCFYLALEGFPRQELVMTEGFKAIGKEFDSFRGKLASAVQEFRDFQEKAAVYEGIARAAMKKAMSLRHRLKKGLRGKT